jgi:hypothetical protein
LHARRRQHREENLSQRLGSAPAAVQSFEFLLQRFCFGLMFALGQLPHRVVQIALDGERVRLMHVMKGDQLGQDVVPLFCRGMLISST